MQASVEKKMSKSTRGGVREKSVKKRSTFEDDEDVNLTEEIPFSPEREASVEMDVINEPMYHEEYIDDDEDDDEKEKKKKEENIPLVAGRSSKYAKKCEEGFFGLMNNVQVNRIKYKDLKMGVSKKKE